MSTQLSQQQIEQIANAIYAGRKIEAIKLHREATNSDLAYAKDFVERLEAELRVREPEKFAASKSKGCMAGTSAILVLVLTLAGILFMLARG